MLSLTSCSIGNHMWAIYEGAACQAGSFFLFETCFSDHNLHTSPANVGSADSDTTTCSAAQAVKAQLAPASDSLAHDEFHWFAPAGLVAVAQCGGESLPPERGFRRRRASSIRPNQLPPLATPHIWAARRPSIPFYQSAQDNRARAPISPPPPGTSRVPRAQSKAAQSGHRSRRPPTPRKREESRGVGRARQPGTA